MNHFVCNLSPDTWLSVQIGPSRPVFVARKMHYQQVHTLNEFYESRVGPILIATESYALVADLYPKT